MSRTSPDDIRSLIDTLPSIDLEFYVRQAHIITNRVAAAATVEEETLTLIETLLGAHYYSLRDPRYIRRKVGESDATFVVTDYWKQAALIDPTGTLNAMAAGVPIDIIWLGQPESEKLDWHDQN